MTPNDFDLLRPPHDPMPKPAMKTERTMETMGVVTPNLAILSRSQTTSYTRLQKPEMKKKRKNHRVFKDRLLQTETEE